MTRPTASPGTTKVLPPPFCGFLHPVLVSRIFEYMHKNPQQSSGSLLATAGKDKKLRVLDPRAGSAAQVSLSLSLCIAILHPFLHRLLSRFEYRARLLTQPQEVEAHQGVKPSKVTFATNLQRLITTGKIRIFLGLLSPLFFLYPVARVLSTIDLPQVSASHEKGRPRTGTCETCRSPS